MRHSVVVVIYLSGCDWSYNLLLKCFVFVLMQLFYSNYLNYFVIAKKYNVLVLVLNNIFYVS